MKNKFAAFVLFSMLSLSTNTISSLAIHIQLTYEFDNIEQFGDLSITKFTVEPSENISTITSDDIVLAGAMLVTKHIALQAALMTKKNPSKIIRLTQKHQQKVNANEATKARLQQEIITQQQLKLATNKNLNLAIKNLLQMTNNDGEDV
jgi:hypothetical protein